MSETSTDDSFVALPATRRCAIERTVKRISDLHTGRELCLPYESGAAAIRAEERVEKLLLGEKVLVGREGRYQIVDAA